MINLYQHQLDALEQTKSMNRCAYYLDMGLGKTFVGAEKLMMLHGENQRDLLICQKSKIEDWIDHFNEHYDIPIFNLTNTKEFKEFWKSNNGVGVINYELAWRRKELIKLSDFTLMLDESSLIQNHKKAKQSKFVLSLNPENVILLSGTPVGGKYENLWSQLKLLGWNISEELYERQYVNWTLTDDDGSGIRHKIVDKDNPYKNVERLKYKMRKYGAVFMKTEECFELPEQRFQRINVPSSREYKLFMEHSYICIGDEELIGDNTLSKVLYARQLCGQYNQEKLNAVRELLESTNDRVIIFYSFNAELEHLKRICEQLNRSVSEINGHNKDLTAYNDDSSSVTLVQYQAGSKGLNLQKCNKIVYFTLPLSSEDFEQSKKRIHRIGQNETCIYYLMICKNSIEEHILKTLEMRKDFTDELFT